MKKIFLIVSLCFAGAISANAQDNFIHTPKGALVKMYTHNTGERLKLNDVVTLDVIQKTDKDSLLGSTYAVGHPAKIKIQASENVADLMEVFPMLTVKDSVYVKVPTDSIFKGMEGQRPPFLPKGSGLVFILKIDKVQTLDEAIAERNASIEAIKNAETTNREKYIADHKLLLKTTPSGLKYRITQPSLKRKPLAGDTLLVNYTGRTLDGKVFDSSIQANAQKAGLQQEGRTYEPLEVVAGAGGVIKGWEEGLLLLNEGSKAEMIIPSDLAYGEQGNGDIPPYSTLIFDLELVKIKPVKHTAVKAPVKRAPVKKHTPAKKKS